MRSPWNLTPRCIWHHGSAVACFAIQRKRISACVQRMCRCFGRDDRIHQGTYNCWSRKCLGILSWTFTSMIAWMFRLYPITEGSFCTLQLLLLRVFPYSKALGLIKLQKWVDSLPPGFYVVADNANILSEQMLIPFTGSLRQVPEHSTYNYFLSQLRIRVEQAFGQYSVKWRIIWKPLKTKLSTSSIVLTTCARLRNFIIDND